MEIPIGSKDQVAFLTESSGKSSPFTSKRHTHRSNKSSSGVTDFQDTIHYLSPASTIARTEYEGDLDYQQLFFRDLIPDKYEKGGHVGQRKRVANLAKKRAPKNPQISNVPLIKRMTKHEKSSYAGSYNGSISSGSSSVPCDEHIVQRTLAVVKPEAYEYRDVVLRAVNEAGLKVLHKRTVHLTPEQVSEIYEKYYGMPTFPHMVVSMSVSPILVLALQAPNAVEKWKTMIGPLGVLREEWFFPYSVKHRFGLLGDIPQALHASEGYFEACRENRYFYPRDVLEPLAHEETKVKDYVTVALKATLVQGLTEIVRTKPIDPILSLAEWLLLHNPYQPRMPDKVAMTHT